MLSQNFFKRWRALLACAVTLPLLATDPPPPAITNINGSGSTKNLRFAPYPGAQSYTFYSATNAGGPFAVNPNFFQAPYITSYTTNIIGTNPPTLVTNLAYEWRLTNATAPNGFFTLSTTTLSSNASLAGHVLNRLAYGPTPDELDRVTAIGPQAYINEQLSFDGIPDTLDSYTVETTNAVFLDPTTNWTFINMTGTMATTPFYLFTTAAGDMYVDDIELHPYLYMQNITTNVVNGTNVLATNRVFTTISSTNFLVNGSFESALSPWTSAGGASGSAIDSSQAHSGSSSLHVASTTGASSEGSSYVRQTNAPTYLTTNSWGNTVTNTYASTDPVILSYWYLPSASSSKLRLKLGSGLNSSPGGLPTTPTWVYATATGTANANSRIYIYLNNAGVAYVDDVKLVAGAAAGVGPNLLANGDFESALSGTWTNSPDFTNSALSYTTAHSGGSSLRLVASSAGGGLNDSVQQTISPALTNGATYTVSYWYIPASPGVNLTVRLDGSVLQSPPDINYSGQVRRLNLTTAGLGELRAWFCQRAVNSPRQLFEIMSQFWENHFVTQQSKSVDYIGGLGFDGTTAGVTATDWEYREVAKWRNAMLDPNCTFYDLLKISAESPAMIVYLDTVNSKGSGNNIANENYARELLELFTFGVDNGYDQNDIILLSRAWTGWSVQLVDAVNANNPFAPVSLTYYPNTNSSSTANKVGVLAFNYLSGNHGTNRGALFAGKTVPARFGPPWTTKVYSSNAPPGSYQLTIPARLTSATNSIQDGYDVLNHFANLPFTEEYLSVKLCRLFVHDDFPNPVTTTNLPPGEYDFYDYTNPDRSAEAELVHQCMLAWENSSPKGNIRAVLATIFNSDLFRSQAAVAQKVKTPFEFVASSLRALRSTNTAGTLTATTDGYSFATPLNNMGQMLLFDRAAPDGYPEVGTPWISGGTLVERIRFAQALCMTNGASLRTDAGAQFVDPVGLLKKKVAGGNWNNAGAVADYFLGLIYPSEGAGNLSLYRSATLKYLDTADDGVTTSLFSGLGNTSGTYENRVRGMVALLMAFQRFQEQ